jgi:hypothetical protein
LAARRERLRREWTSVLGPAKPADRLNARAVAQDDPQIAGVKVERFLLDVEPGIVVPVVLLLPNVADPQPGPTKMSTPRVPVVLAVAQAGRREFLKHRSAEIAELLTCGVAVCLPDLRGLGETIPDGSRERWGATTSQSSTELMLGGTMVGARLRDLRAVVAFLRTRSDVDSKRIAVWGDSFAKANRPEREFRVPRNMDDRPRWSEPLGGLLALLIALYEDDIRAVSVRGGLSDFQCVLSHQFVYIPHDVVIPGVLKTGDLPDLAAAVAPRPLRLDDLVDGFNRLHSPAAARAVYEPAIRTYQSADAADRLVIHESQSPTSRWLLDQLRDR